MTECDKFKVYISDYLENKISPHSKKQFNSHLGTCPECSIRIKQISKMQSLLSGLKTYQCSPGFSVNLQRRLRSETGTSFFANPNTKKITYGFSFAALLLIMIFSFNEIFFTVDDGPTQISNPIIQENQNPNVSPSQPSNQYVKQSDYNNKADAEGVEIKTKDSTDTTQPAKDEEKNSRIKYVDKK